MIPPQAARPTSPQYSLADIVGYFLKLGTVGFGGPVALVGFMHRDLVEDRKWITESEYREGMALAQLAPGPLAAQLAIYLGFVHYKVLGATLAGLGFVIPSFLMVVALGWAYVAYGGLSWMQAVFYGVGPCVIAIIFNSALKLTRRTIGSDRVMWAVFLVSAACTIITENEIVWLFLGAGILVWLIKAPPAWLRGSPPGVPLVLMPFASLGDDVPRASGETLWKILVYFTEAGAFRVRQRPCDCAVSLRRRRQGIRMAQRSAVSRCGRGCHDHARTGRHHGRLHRLSRSGS